jgi:hypothetical protein
MKIFAKRKRKAAPAGATAKERDTFASDPVVEELLSKDPKEWNSKERRMIQRYQLRKDESLEASSDVVDEPEESVEKGNESVEEEIQKEDGNSSNNDNGSVDDESSSDDQNEEPSEKVADTAQPAATTEKDDATGEDAAASAKWSDEPTTFDEKVEDNEDGKIDPEHEVYKLLDKLNSKMKRTLSRKLDRQGATVLDEVHNEAKKILDENADEQESKKRDSEALETKLENEEKQSNKKRKKEGDLSHLSAEERLRREDQRRKQQEAVERRAKGEDKTPGYKHALNSERRRANKRKPKWKNGTSSSSSSSRSVPIVKNGQKTEHNYSGYNHRKQAV